MKVMTLFGAQLFVVEKEEIDGGTIHFGAFAEQATTDGLRYRMECHVVHRGTGATAAIVGTRRAAVDLMARLEALPVNWAFRKREGARYARIRQYLSSLQKSDRRHIAAIYEHSKALEESK